METISTTCASVSNPLSYNKLLQLLHLVQLISFDLKGTITLNGNVAKRKEANCKALPL